MFFYQSWNTGSLMEHLSRSFFSSIYCASKPTWKVFPCIFGLLPNETEATYIRFYREVFNRVRRQGNNPDDTSVDFERATIYAMHHMNQHTEIKGCFYHLSSNICKTIQESGLQQRYNEDKEFAFTLRMLSEIIFLTPNDVIEAFE